ncbi:hypothetical protein ACYPKM_00590 [Pseudomonas aeruginosa]
MNSASRCNPLHLAIGLLIMLKRSVISVVMLPVRELIIAYRFFFMGTTVLPHGLTLTVCVLLMGIVILALALIAGVSIAVLVGLAVSHAIGCVPYFRIVETSLGIYDLREDCAAIPEIANVIPHTPEQLEVFSGIAATGIITCLFFALACMMMPNLKSVLRNACQIGADALGKGPSAPENADSAPPKPIAEG